MGIKKFVSMQEINRVFDDLGAVDYVTVDEVTDSMVHINVHLKTFTEPKPGSKMWSEYSDRCFVLGKLLDRKVEFRFSKSTCAKKVMSLMRMPLKVV